MSVAEVGDRCQWAYVFREKEGKNNTLNIAICLQVNTQFCYCGWITVTEYFPSDWYS